MVLKQDLSKFQRTVHPNFLLQTRFEDRKGNIAKSFYKANITEY